MASLWKQSANSSEIKVFAACLAAILVLAGLVNHATAPGTSPARTRAEIDRQKQRDRPSLDYPEQAEAYVNKLARQCEGDYSRLSPEDQHWLNGVTAGHGVESIRARYKALRDKDAAR